MSDRSYLRYTYRTSYLNRIGDDCFRLILQYTQIKTLITTSCCSQRSYLVTNHIATKYLPILKLNLIRIYRCQCYSNSRISTLIPKLKLTNWNHLGLPIIQRAKYLQTLDLTCNYLGPEGMRDLTQVFASLPCLQTLNLTGNYIMNEGIRVLSPHLASIPRLQTLNLSCNELDDEGIRHLAPHLVLCPQLHSLDLSYNLTGSDVMKVLSSFPRLQILHHSCYWGQQM